MSILPSYSHLVGASCGQALGYAMETEWHKALLLSSECSYLKETDAKTNWQEGTKSGVIWEIQLGTRSPQQHPPHWAGDGLWTRGSEKGDAETESWRTGWVLDSWGCLNRQTHIYFTYIQKHLYVTDLFTSSLIEFFNSLLMSLTIFHIFIG